MEGGVGEGGEANGLWGNGTISARDRSGAKFATLHSRPPPQVWFVLHLKPNTFYVFLLCMVKVNHKGVMKHAFILGSVSMAANNKALILM
jgi:hypothetical protein